MTPVLTDMERYKPLRWSVMQISREFGISRTAIQTRLGNTKPIDEDGYSTEQVIHALHGDLDAAKLRSETARGKLLELKIARFEGSMIHMREAREGMNQIAQEIVQIIRGSILSRRDQDDILTSCSRVDQILDRVAREQAEMYGDPRKIEEEED